MSKLEIGIVATGQTAKEILETIQKADNLGIKGAWLTSGGVRLDPLTIFSAAAQKTNQIKLGTSIVTHWSRHPLAISQQVQVISELAPGRFRLGLGPGGKTGMESTYGLEFRSPLSNLREYVRILKALFKDGEVNFDGTYYHAHANIGGPVDVPVMVSALRRSSFQFCGEEADGAITWLCPGPYLKDIAIPEMHRASEKKNQPHPKLIAHAVVCVHEDISEVKTAMREQMSFYPKQPHYAQMFADAGFPEAKTGEWSDGMINSVVFSGSENKVNDRIEELVSTGPAELLISVITAGKDKAKSKERSMEFLGGLCS